MELAQTGVSLLMAVAIDVSLRELPNRWHPVAWMGLYIQQFRHLNSASGRIPAMIAGASLVTSGALACAVFGWQLQRFTSSYPLLVAAGLQAIVLKQTFSIKSLARAAAAVEAPLRSGDLGLARRQLAFHLVSRDTSDLDESQIAAATIQSVAENTSDSIIAPLFYFVVGGLPIALAYRFINTCDAMIGYRTPALEWFGKPAARLDDLLNLIPARLTAAMILAAGVVLAKRPLASLPIWFRDRYATESPNAGQPMSAAAGVLGVELEKRNSYVLGRGQRQPTAEDIARAVRLLWVISAMATLGAGLWLFSTGS